MPTKGSTDTKDQHHNDSATSTNMEYYALPRSLNLFFLFVYFLSCAQKLKLPIMSLGLKAVI